MSQKKKINSLYIHIPFCKNICSYCDFCKYNYNDSWAKEYVNKIVREINDPNYFPLYKTIYIGGGSPSSLSLDLLELLLSSLSDKIEKDGEFSIEVNPGDVTKEMAELFKKYKVNRVSIGVQTFNKEILKLMNRNQNSSEIFDTIKVLRDNGITNISCDLIYGVPGQNYLTILYDLIKLTSLNISHISTYALQVEKNTVLYNKGIKPLNDDIQANQYSFITHFLKLKKFIRYEVSNFCKSNMYSRHNKVYWNGKQYRGIGAGASGYEDDVRYTNTRSITEFLKDTYSQEKETLSIEDKEYEFIILNLRLKEGFDLNEFKTLFNKNFLETYKKQVEELTNNNMIEIKDNRVFVKENKMFVLNQILSCF